MSNIPRQRKSGQTGGGGRIGQTSNRSASQSRGGRPHAGGGGTGKKPPSRLSCAVVVLGALAATATLPAAVWLVLEVVWS